jgi:hypothetical protein
VRRTVAVGLVALALGACAEPRWTYEKPRGTPAQLDHDLEACRRDAFRPQRFALRPSDRYDSSVVNRCMERKGYAVRPLEE